MDDNLFKPRHRAERAHYPHYVLLQVDRTLSWLYRDKSFEYDRDSQLVFLCIVFNVANAQ
jgi:hypothetical protein